MKKNLLYICIAICACSLLIKMPTKTMDQNKLQKLTNDLSKDLTKIEDQLNRTELSEINVLDFWYILNREYQKAKNRGIDQNRLKKMFNEFNDILQEAADEQKISKKIMLKVNIEDRVPYDYFETEYSKKRKLPSEYVSEQDLNFIKLN